jgi:nanoRNase/pAp phosphatase (c-di-AMP/oligoRNAs hydrolase)
LQEELRTMQQRLDRLLEAVEGGTGVLILPHNDPDPDAIASAVALQFLLRQKLGVDAYIGYSGIIGRAENKALVRYLRHPIKRLGKNDLRAEVPKALVDTQPGAGNNSLSPETVPTIVLDHHPLREETAAARFSDVRPELGSTSTILTEYLQAADVEPSKPLATALFYGIKTDTMGLVRGSSRADVAAYFYLQPRIDVDALMEIERAQVPADYFQKLDAALRAAQVLEDVVLSYLGLMNRPDMAAEMADLLMRLQGARWAICMGVYRENLVLAVRSRGRQGGSGALAREIVKHEGTAGGHGVMAGGQVPLRGEDAERVAQRLGQRALAYLKIPPDTVGKPLIE